MRRWIRDPYSGGVPISDSLKRATTRRLLAHAEKHYAGRYARLDLRFRGPFCYIDAYREPDPRHRPLPGSGETLGEYRERLRNTPIHLCRLRH